MARYKPTLTFAGSLEVETQEPLDARTVVPTKADLTVASNFPYAYKGLLVYVVDEKKLYTLTDMDTTQSSSWQEVGNGGTPTGGLSGWGIAGEGSATLTIQSGTGEGETVIDVTAYGFASASEYEVLAVATGGEGDWRRSSVSVTGKTATQFTLGAISMLGASSTIAVDYVIAAKGYSNIPLGGTTGQSLVKASNTDGDVEWVTEHKTLTQAEYDALSEEEKDNGTIYFISDAGGGGGSLPAGGTTGQVLSKKTDADGDTEWKDSSSVPAGGTAGQVLAKKSNTDGDVEWAFPDGNLTASTKQVGVFTDSDGYKHNIYKMTVLQSGIQFTNNQFVFTVKLSGALAMHSVDQIIACNLMLRSPVANPTYYHPLPGRVYESETNVNREVAVNFKRSSSGSGIMIQMKTECIITQLGSGTDLSGRDLVGEILYFTGPYS